MLKVEDVLDRKLEDDSTSTGGTSNSEETLLDFLEDIYGESLDVSQYSLEDINIMLKENGIKPIQ